MKLNIKTEKNEPLLSRKLVTVDVEFANATPSRAELLSKCSELLKADSDLVSIDKIETEFGSRRAEVTIFLYDNKETLKKFTKAVKTEDKNG